MDTYFSTKERLFELIEERHLSIHALAIKSGVAPSTIKNILYGKSKNPGIVTIKLLCDGLGISLYDFFDTGVFRSYDLEDI
jgi:transcriptional regulator with XRE-family HTH domain